MAWRPPPGRLMVITDLVDDLDRRADTQPRDWHRHLERHLPMWVERWVDAGVDMVQARNKAPARQLGDRRLYRLVERLVQASAGRMTVLVNERLDIAIAAGADGVHLPVSSVAPRAMRRATNRRPGHRLLVGCSCHSRLEVEAALAAGADYATFGPVFDTPSKRVYGPPLGLRALAEASRLGLPLLALGGVEASDLPEAQAHGASGAAAIRTLHDPERLVEMGRQAGICWPLPRVADLEPASESK